MAIDILFLSDFLIDKWFVKYINGQKVRFLELEEEEEGKTAIEKNNGKQRGFLSPLPKFPLLHFVGFFGLNVIQDYWYLFAKSFNCLCCLSFFF